MASTSSSQLEDMPLSQFRTAVVDILNILNSDSEEFTQKHAQQVKSKLSQLMIIESEYLCLKERNSKLEAALKATRNQLKLNLNAASACFPAPATSLAHLPDLCLLALFRELPLKDQLTAHQVCSKWNRLVSEVTSRRTAVRIYFKAQPSESYAFEEENFPDYCLSLYSKSRRFLQNDDGSLMYPPQMITPWNSLYPSPTSEATVKQITAAFAGLNELHICIRSHSLPSEKDHLNQSIRLLEQLAPQLVTLHLSLSLVVSESIYDRIYTTINAMSLLKHLTLCMSHVPFADLPVVSQLEELFFRSNVITAEQFVAMLRQYGEGNLALRRVEYKDSSERGSPRSAEQFTTLSARLRACFTRLDLNPQNLLICSYFHDITHFNFGIKYHATLRYIFSHLSQLTKLVHLGMRFKMDLIHEDELQIPLPQLKSVKTLFISVGFQSHRQIEQLNLQWTMPNVQMIFFDFTGYHCEICDVEKIPWSYNKLPANFEVVKNCARQLFASLKQQCTVLRALLHSRKDVIGTAEELLEEGGALTSFESK